MGDDATVKQIFGDEIGSTGLDISEGRLKEEFLRELEGTRKFRTYKEMRDNDPVVGSMLFAIQMLIREVDWTVEAFDDTPKSKADAEFIFECMNDMSESWTDTIAEILSFLPFGFSAHEEVYKRRNGPGGERDTRSRFSDGRIGWAKLPTRAQETIERWELDPNGQILSFVQVAPPTYRPVEVPWEKFLLFRTTVAKGNPEGRSILRNAYRPWFFKKRIEEIEGIGIERDLAGLPVAHVPAELLSNQPSPANRALRDQLVALVRNIKRDQKEGVLFPRVFDKDGHEMYKLELLSTGGRRQFDTSQIIGRYDTRIAMTSLADFVLMGHEKVGSFALVSSRTNLFAVALGAWLDSIAQVFNRFGIPRLLSLNGLDVTEPPQLTHGDIEQQDLGELGAFLQAAAAAGMPLFPDTDLENEIRRRTKLPEKSEDDVIPPRPRPTPRPPTQDGDEPPDPDDPEDGAPV